MKRVQNFAFTSQQLAAVTHVHGVTAAYKL